MKHSKDPTAAPAKPNFSAYDSVDLKEHGNSLIPKKATYDLAFPNSNTDSSNNQQPVSNPVYSLGGLSNNPMYGTSVDVEEVKQSLEQAQNNASTAPVNGQQEFNEIESSDEIPPPIPPQNF